MKKRVIGLFLIILISVFVIGCEGKKESVLVEKTVETITIKTVDLGPGATVGNHTYLPIHIWGNPDDHAQEILQVLDVFERAHPELEVTSWSIEKQQGGYSTKPYIFGIWVNHR